MNSGAPRGTKNDRFDLPAADDETGERARNKRQTEEATAAPSTLPVPTAPPPLPVCRYVRDVTGLKYDRFIRKTPSDADLLRKEGVHTLYQFLLRETSAKPAPKEYMPWLRAAQAKPFPDARTIRFQDTLCSCKANAGGFFFVNDSGNVEYTRTSSSAHPVLLADAGEFSGDLTALGSVPYRAKAHCVFTSHAIEEDDDTGEIKTLDLLHTTQRDAETEEEKPVELLTIENDRITAMSTSPKGMAVLTESGQIGYIRATSIADGGISEDVWLELPNRPDADPYTSICFSPCGSRLLAVSRSGYGLCHDIGTGIQTPFSCVPFLEPDELMQGISLCGSTLTCWTSQNRVFQMDLRTQKLVVEYRPEKLCEPRTPHAAHSFKRWDPEDQTQLLVCKQLANTHTITVVTTNRYTEVSTFKPGVLSGYPVSVFRYPTHSVFARIEDDGTVVLGNLESESVVLQPPAPPPPPPSLLDLPAIR